MRPAKGRVTVWVDPYGKRAGIAELRCETEPVSYTDDFIRLSQQVAELAASHPNGTPESISALKSPDGSGRTIKDLMDDVSKRMRENMRIGGVGGVEGPLGYYVHHNRQVGVLAQFNQECPEPMRSDVCMHIAALKPLSLKRDQVDSQLNEKIVDGEINRWYGEVCLLEQPFVKDDKKTVQEALNEASKGLTITRFVRLEVGGG